MNKNEVQKTVTDFIDKNYRGNEQVEIMISGGSLPYNAILKIRPNKISL